MANLFKHRRSETGLPLSEIARVTRIKESYLRAIEEEDFPKLPIEVYTRGYIREYAKFLGIPPGEALTAYEQYLDSCTVCSDKTTVSSPRETKQAPAVVSANTRPKSVPVERASSSGSAATEVFRRVLSHRSVVWVLPAVLAILMIYSALPPKKEVSHPTLKLEEPVAVKTEQQPRESAETPVGPTSGLQVQEVRPVPESLPAQSQVSPHRLDIVATDKVWLQVIIDGTEKRAMLLNQGDQVGFRATRNFTLKIGNAGGLRLVFNQQEIDNLGNKGQVINLSLPASGSEPSLLRNNLGDRIIPSSEASHP